MPFDLQLYQQHCTVGSKPKSPVVEICKTTPQKVGNFSPVYAQGKQFMSDVSKLVKIGAG